MSYEAIIAPLENGVAIPRADRLKLFNVCGRKVVAGIEHEDGEIGVFFPDDGILSDDFCKANDLYPRFDESGARIGGGFFDPKKPRVRAQNFRGQKSEGFWMPLECLTYTGLSLEKIQSSMPVGTAFDTVNKKLVCEKYFTPATLRQLKSSGKVQRKVLGFPKHIDTKQFAYESFKIDEGARVYITEKLHGTSGRTAYAYVNKEKPRTWVQKLFRQPAAVVGEWEYLTGTRNVILKNDPDVANVGFYGDDTFRKDISDKFKTLLHKNEVIYYEIVGYTADVPIMPIHETPRELKAIRKQYGNEMAYRYGCVEGQNKIYVYRIAFANEDGHTVDLPWEKVKLRCAELGLNHVPEIAGGLFEAVKRNGDEIIVNWGTQTDPLHLIVDNYMDGPSLLDHTHIREGVVLRVENPDGTTLYQKAKSFPFKVLEGIVKNNDEYVDPEEAS